MNFIVHWSRVRGLALRSPDSEQIVIQSLISSIIDCECDQGVTGSVSQLTAAFLIVVRLQIEVIQVNSVQMIKSHL